MDEDLDQQGTRQEPPADREDGRDEGPAPVTVRYSRKRFLIVGGAIVAGIIGLFEVFRRLASSGGNSVTRTITDMVSSFPVKAVEPIPDDTWADWSIEVEGLVERPFTVDAAKWQVLPRVEVKADLQCVEGWSADDLIWKGVSPATLLAEARLKPEGSWVVFHAHTGEYYDSIPLELVNDPQTLLADSLNGQPLSSEHGGPVRLVVPAQLGYKSVKWVKRIQVTDHLVKGFWEQRGYSVDAPV